MEGRELVIGERVAEPHIVGVATADEHIGLRDGVGRRVDLLTEADDVTLVVQVTDTFLHTGEHLGGTHRHIVHGNL